MPMYEYLCTSCKKRFDAPQSIAERDNPIVCECGGRAERDKIASMQPHSETGFGTEMLSDALGVHPDQIPEARRRFPDHRFHPDGRMVIGSAGERKRVMRDLGFHDLNSYY
jgi:putative FmdB family regulatory protein